MFQTKKPNLPADCTTWSLEQINEYVSHELKKPFLSVKEVSELLGVSSMTVRRWHYDGVFKGLQVRAGGAIRYALPSVAALLYNRTGEA